MEGKKLGRKLGFPTANILISEGLKIDNGVYRSRVTVDQSTHYAITNVGYNPTVGIQSRRIESYIFDFEGDIYGQQIEVELLEKVRDEIKFKSVDDLRVQVLKDIELVKGRG